LLLLIVSDWSTTFFVSTVILVLTPAFFAAAHFVILGRVLTILGDDYSLFPSRFVLPFFLTLDLVSICIQAIGSGIAGAAETVSAKVFLFSLRLRLSWSSTSFLFTWRLHRITKTLILVVT